MTTTSRARVCVERDDGTREGRGVCGRARGVIRRVRRARGEISTRRDGWMVGSEISTTRLGERIGTAGRDDATRAMGA